MVFSDAKTSKLNRATLNYLKAFIELDAVMLLV